LPDTTVTIRPLAADGHAHWAPLLRACPASCRTNLPDAAQTATRSRLTAFLRTDIAGRVADDGNWGATSPTSHNNAVARRVHDRKATLAPLQMSGQAL